MPVLPFSSDAEVVGFAKDFINRHNERFRKDINICLTPNANGEHAYFPALTTCIAFSDFLSGLYAGDLQTHALPELKNYARDFMDSADYTDDRLNVLYECFRHKVAHLALPYAVFDTDTKPKTFAGQPRRLITWQVHEGSGKPSIDIVQKQKTQLPGCPWPVYYDHWANVYLRSLADDILESIPKYIHRLENDGTSRDKFRKCMEVYFPQ